MAISITSSKPARLRPFARGFCPASSMWHIARARRVGILAPR